MTESTVLSAPAQSTSSISSPTTPSDGSESQQQHREDKKVSVAISSINDKRSESGAESSNDSAVSTRSNSSSTSGDVNSSSNSTPALVDSASISSEIETSLDTSEQAIDCSRAAEHSDDIIVIRESGDDEEDQLVDVAGPAQEAAESSSSATKARKSLKPPVTRWPGDNLRHSGHFRGERRCSGSSGFYIGEPLPSQYYDPRNQQPQQFMQQISNNPRHMVALQPPAPSDLPTAPAATSNPIVPSSFISSHEQQQQQHCDLLQLQQQATGYCNLMPITYAAAVTSQQQLSSPAIYTASRVHQTAAASFDPAARQQPALALLSCLNYQQQHPNYHHPVLYGPATALSGLHLQPTATARTHTSLNYAQVAMASNQQVSPACYAASAASGDSFGRGAGLYNASEQHVCGPGQLFGRKNSPRSISDDDTRTTDRATGGCADIDRCARQTCAHPTDDSSSDGAALFGSSSDQDHNSSQKESSLPLNGSPEQRYYRGELHRRAPVALVSLTSTATPMETGADVGSCCCGAGAGVGDGSEDDDHYNGADDFGVAAVIVNGEGGYGHDGGVDAAKDQSKRCVNSKSQISSTFPSRPNTATAPLTRSSQTPLSQDPISSVASSYCPPRAKVDAIGATNLMVHQQQQQQQKQQQQRHHRHEGNVTPTGRVVISSECESSGAANECCNFVSQNITTSSVDTTTAPNNTSDGGRDQSGDQEANRDSAGLAGDRPEVAIYTKAELNEVDGQKLPESTNRNNPVNSYQHRPEPQQYQRLVNFAQPQQYAAYNPSSQHSFPYVPHPPVAINNQLQVPLAASHSYHLYGPNPDYAQPPTTQLLLLPNGNLQPALSSHQHHNMALASATPPTPQAHFCQAAPTFLPFTFGEQEQLALNNNNEFQNAQFKPPAHCRDQPASSTYLSNHHQPMIPYYVHPNAAAATCRSQFMVNQSPQPASSAFYMSPLVHHNNHYHQNYHEFVGAMQQPIAYCPPMVMFDPSPHQQGHSSHHPHHHQAHIIATAPVDNYMLPQSALFHPPAAHFLPPATFNPRVLPPPRRHLTADHLSYLPIDAQSAKIRQAYGMDKVWQDEFDQIFSQISTHITWTLIEVESNPTIREQNNIIAYKGRYIISANYEKRDNNSPTDSSVAGDVSSRAELQFCENSDGSTKTDAGINEKESFDQAESFQECEAQNPGVVSLVEGKDADSPSMGQHSGDDDSDCDSGALVDSTTSGSSESNSNRASSMNETEAHRSNSSPDSGKVSSERTTSCGDGQLSGCSAMKPTITSNRVPTKFRMFIDSAKVRFCCDSCGHGWTSMKGRVVFWYELFEVVEDEQESGSGYLIGYCAYKLFGQQCDVCKIENRFERPMWYPEEVTKALGNLYNKIGQVYFGFKMPAIDKQRRAGKPKTSHNCSLCQACHDGVCTDRK